MAWGQHSVFLTFTGGVRVAGLNNYGQLGLGNTESPQKEIQSLTLQNVKQVSKGGNFTMFLMKDGTVKGVGHNINGQLGIGNTVNQSTIQTIPLTAVKQIICGQNYTMFLMENGTVKAAGLNSFGQLGLGNTTSPQAVIQTVPISGVKQISSGAHHTLFLLENGQVKSVGRNNIGQLANGNTGDQSVIQNVPITGVKQVAAGYAFSMFLMNDGTVRGIGENAQGQLGLGNTSNQPLLQTIPIEEVKELLPAGSAIFFAMNDGTLKGVGNNAFGQLGIGNTVNQSTIQNIEIRDFKEASCGNESVFYLMENGTVKVAGRNYEGQLGNSDISGTSATIKDSSYRDIGALEKILSELVKKWLIKAGEKIMKFEGGSWLDVGILPVTRSMFLSSGMYSLYGIPLEKLNEIQNPEILLWNPERGKSTKLSTVGVPRIKIIKGNRDISVSTITKLRVSSSTTGIVRIILSSDSGVTWKGKQVLDINNATDVKTYGLTPAECNALSKIQLAELLPSGKLRVAYYLEQVSSTDSAFVSEFYVNEITYQASPNISKIQASQTLVMQEAVLIESKQSDGSWKAVPLDEMIYAPKGQEWQAIELRAKMKDDQQLNGIAFSWS